MSLPLHQPPTRDNTGRGALLACCALPLALGVAGCHSTPSSALDPVTFRVMSFNIHHGVGVDGTLDLQRIAEVIQTERADIVALQEVDKGVIRTGGRDLTAELAQLTGMTGVFSNNFHFQGGEYGNAVLTRFPVTSWTNQYYRMIREGEQRGLLQLVLDVRGHELVFMNTHLDYRPDDTERLLNVEEIKTAASMFSVASRQVENSADVQNDGTPSTPNQPILICGDFNTRPDTLVHERMEEQFRDAWEVAGAGPGFSFPSTSPNRRIDYFWISKSDTLRPVRLWVPQTGASDHRPLVGEFVLRDESRNLGP